MVIMLRSRRRHAHSVITYKKSQEEKHPSGQSSKGFKKNDKVCPVEWKDVPRFAVSVSSHKNIPKTAGVPQTGQSAAWTTIPPPVRVSAASLSHSLSLMPFRREKCGNTVTSIHWWWWRLHKWYIYIYIKLREERARLPGPTYKRRGARQAKK